MNNNVKAIILKLHICITTIMNSILDFFFFVDEYFELKCQKFSKCWRDIGVFWCKDQIQFTTF